MRKGLFIAGAACLTLGPIAYDSVAYYEDQQLKSFTTKECQAFNELTTPEFTLIPRRYTHEDKTEFYEKRARCERSVQK